MLEVEHFVCALSFDTITENFHDTKSFFTFNHENSDTKSHVNIDNHGVKFGGKNHAEVDVLGRTQSALLY